MTDRLLKPGDDVKHKYFKLKSLVKRRENYQKYQSVGGVWTVDTYKLGPITVQIMDEGYSARLFTRPSELDVFEFCRGNETVLEFRAGSADDLAALLAVMDGGEGE
jgi:hypothetical protein